MGDKKTNKFQELFEELFEQAQKARERKAIQAIITAKHTRISSAKQTSTTRLTEISDAMFQQTDNVLPNALKGALQGKSAESAESYLKKQKKPTLHTPVKGG